jgi:PAS domain S-box-containing protein
MQEIFDPASYGGSAFSLPIGAVALLSLCLGVWAVWYERGRRVSLSLFAATIAVATYLGGFAFMVGSATPEVALFWGRFAYIGVPLIVPAIYQFSMDLLGRRDQRRVLIRAAWAVGIIYAWLAVRTDLLVSGVFRVEWGYITRITLWTLPILLWSGALLVLAIRDFVRAYHHAEAVQRARIRLFAIPIAIGSLAFVDYMPSLGLPVAPWGFVSFAAFMASAAWAVARYHLPELTPSFAAHQIVRTIAEPLLVCDERGAIAFANPAASLLFGWSQDELVGERLHVLFGTEDAHRILSDDGAAPTEMELLGRKGEPLAVSVTTNRVAARSGQQVGTVVVARDIRHIRRAAREMERREQRFRALIEHARDVIMILNGDGRIIYESPAARELLGYPPEESFASLVFDRIHPEDLESTRAVFAGLLERPGGLVDAECRIRHAEGDYRVFEYRGKNLLDNPAVRGIVINARDVHEERQLAAQLQQAQKMEAIGRLAGGVAHDFNNILTAIQGNVALIGEDLPEGGEFGAELREIEEGARRASRLTSQLLSFSRRQVVRAELLELNGLVRETQSMLERLIGENILLTLRLDARSDVVRADRGQLEQIVVNLVVNARDALHAGGRIEIATADVEISPEAARAGEFQLVPGSYALLTVTDDGHGMDDETRSRIFEPFFTTKPSGKGTGLGLSTVYGAVRQASGYIGVETVPDVGTTFSVYLPRVEDAPVRPGSQTESPVELESDGDLVLVVEDEAPVRTLIARILERRGYTVLRAADGQEALELAERQREPINLLIADLVMPGLTGREVADRLTALYPEMAVILISGYTADEVVREGILTGARNFLPKPFTPDALARTVAAVLGQKNPSTAR